MLHLGQVCLAGWLPWLPLQSTVSYTVATKNQVMSKPFRLNETNWADRPLLEYSVQVEQ